MRTTKPILVGIAMAASILLGGCGAGEPASEPSATQEAPVESAPSAGSIDSIEDGILWARSLDDNVTSVELSSGISAIGEIVPTLDIWFAANNEIGRDLISLNADVQADPVNAHTKVDDLNVIVDKIEAAVEKGNNP
jgi:hypothetical protein